MDVNLILQVLSVLFVVLWTARQSARKGRNPLLWAGIAVLPVVAVRAFGLPEAITILCMAPMIALVFIRSRARAAGDDAVSAISCPRCQHSHDPGPSFCTNCGWELSRAYATTDASPEAVESGEPVIVASKAETPESAPGAEQPAPAASPDPAPAAEQNTQAAPATAIASHQSESIAAFTATPMKITRPLTASGMTEAGLSLLNQGRFREAVDQFTKAIALDPRYREAWVNRAKAYSELGLLDKADADQRQLEAI